MKKTVALSSKERVDSKTVPPGLDPVYTFPVHIMLLVGNVYNYDAFLKKDG